MPLLTYSGRMEMLGAVSGNASMKCRLLTPPDFSHDHARSRTYRWGEDGISGVSDTHNLQNIAFAFWNEKEYASHDDL